MHMDISEVLIRSNHPLGKDQQPVAPNKDGARAPAKLLSWQRYLQIH